MKVVKTRSGEVREEGVNTRKGRTLQIKFIEPVALGKRTTRPSEYEKSPYKLREIDIKDKPIAWQQRFYKWLFRGVEQSCY